MANAADKDGVTSSRSFTKINKTKKDLLAESKSVDVESDSSWLSTTMSVPKTKSSAEQQAEAQAAQEQAAREQAAAAAAAQASAASRSQTRSATPSTSATTNTTTTTVNASSSAVVSYAGQFVGVSPYVYGGTSPTSGWDCSGFTQYVFAHFGISLPRTSGAQA
ncbi:MAG: C40 family peptidase, partial [Bifidobacterium crudilactis]|nr:C40 family peptidase [Bifidobacterium crudilactis]